MTTAQPRVSGLEVRSIDYVPLRERHGKLWHLGPLWFMSNAQIATLAVGLISITSGGNLIWSLISIVAGTVLGTFFMAFHSAQGPQLGLPQMIQSRPQFGYVGALLVWLFAYVQYAGFNVFNTILAGQAMSKTAHGNVKWWVVAITVLALVVALVGYDIIHRAEQFLTYTFLVVFGVFTVGVLCTLHYPAGSFDLGGFKWTPFLAQFGVVAGYQISWAIYVSDYSRYLPPGVTVRKTFYWTYFGSALGGAWLMVLGSLLAAWAGKDFDTIASINAAGDKVFNGFGAVVLIFSALGLVSVTALNMYGGSLTLISAADSFRKIRPTVGARLITLAVTAGLSLVGALAATVALPGELQQLPAAGALPVHPVDRRQPDGLLRGPPRPLRHRRDLQTPWHIRPLGLARHHRLPGRLRRDDPVLLRRHPVHRTRRPRVERRGHLLVHRPAGLRTPVLVAGPHDRRPRRDRPGRGGGRRAGTRPAARGLRPRGSGPLPTAARWKWSHR